MEKALEKLEVIKKVVNNQPLTDEEITILLSFTHELQSTFAPKPETFTIYTQSGGKISPQEVEVLETFTHNNINLVLHNDVFKSNAYTVSELVTGASVAKQWSKKTEATQKAKALLDKYPGIITQQIKEIQARKQAQHV